MRGRAAVAVGPAGLERLAQAGSAKAFLPRVHGTHPEVVFLNTAGGLTGGDRLALALDVGDGARVTGTTQTAERAYRSASGVAEVDVRLRVGAGARLDWVPQETILFDGSALHRETEVRLEGDAEVLMVESVVLGRRAMGETVSRLDFVDRRRVLRDGAPLWVEPLALADGALARRGPAGLAGAQALAVIAFVARGAEDALAPVRRLLNVDGVEAGASAWDGKLVVRAMAGDPAPLRRLVTCVVRQLSGGVPRVWPV
ncbi:MAG: urease accessory protein UreD [Pseudomonadota bacterium]